jgi:uncharacterized protein (DUF58 family)
MKHLKIKTGAVGVYLIGFVILYLPAMSMAGILLYAFCLYAAFPLISFVFLLIAFFRFRYYEQFSTEHPVKGQEVSYKISLASEARVPGPYVSVRFKLISPDVSAELKDIHTALESGGIYSRTYTIRYPFRGVYKVGIDYIALRDLLGWISLYPGVWYRTFYVYPRIIELARVFPRLQNVIEASGYGQGILDDYTLFRNLQEYGAGQSVKHLAWKKFASTGELFIKIYEKTSWPGVEIYLDLRREDTAGNRILEREDCSVEILVALVKYFFQKQIPTRIHAVNGRDRYEFFGSDRSFFTEFYKSTVNLAFADDYSPGHVFKADMQDKLINASTIIFVTHSLDPEILELVSGSWNSELAVFAVINQSGKTQEQAQSEITQADSLQHIRGSLVFVRGIGTIKENLEA